MTFELQYTDTKSNARAGLITTDHGQIQTPIFMPVGTLGTVKGVHLTELKEDIQAQIILGNTYHLYLRPGLDVIEKAGGLHRFNGFDRPMLTDSGGFQVFSLAGIRKLREEGAEFRSHIDGSKHIFTPEKVMDIERTIGADIMMAFDECPPGDSDYEYAKKSLGLTHRWLDRCIQRFNETEPKYGYNQSLFPIVQGCVYPDLRKQSAEFVASKGADGNAIGGLAVGEPVDKMYEMIEIVNEILPKDKPRYLMGVGTPVNNRTRRGYVRLRYAYKKRTKWHVVHQRWHYQYAEQEMGNGLLSYRSRRSLLRGYIIQQGLFAPSFPCARATGYANRFHT